MVLTLINLVRIHKEIRSELDLISYNLVMKVLLENNVYKLSLDFAFVEALFISIVIYKLIVNYRYKVNNIN